MSERRLVGGLTSPHPLGLMFPALLQEDDLAQRFSSGLDEVLSVVLQTLDDIDAYVDPWLAPDDFVEWLAHWVGVPVQETWTVGRKRAAVAGAVEAYRWRGTVRGLVAEVKAQTGYTPEVEESGGVMASTDGGGEFPMDDPPSLRVRLRVRKADAVDEAALDALVASCKPAHVPHAIEVVRG